MYTKILFYVYIICIICFVDSQVGNQCTLPVRNNKGVCKLVRDCPSAAKQATVGISPVICGRQNNVPIVCCEGTASAKIAPVLPDVPLNVRPFNHDQRVSEKKCREYTTPVVSVVESVPLSAHSSLISYETANCTYDGIPLIFGGQKAVLGEFPHMALLGYGTPTQWLCGGTLISDQFVLTAAHCLNTQHGPVRVVRLGELSISQPEPNSEPEDFDVAQMYKHPEYKRPKIYNDIALIQLSKRVQFNSYKRPACLWSKFDIGTTTTIATGWGTTEHDPTLTSDDLLKVGLNIIDNGQCHNKYTDYLTRKLPDGILRTQICARNTTHLGDTCQGDSGGPIQVPKSNNRCVFYIVGVTSAGRYCGGDIPGLYTRVSEFIDWIENIVWQ